MTQPRKLLSSTFAVISVSLLRRKFRLLSHRAPLAVPRLTATVTNVQETIGSDVYITNIFKIVNK